METNERSHVIMENGLGQGIKVERPAMLNGTKSKSQKKVKE